MSDLLVRLYDLRAGAADSRVRRAFAAEKHLVTSWVRENFGAGWASECDLSFARQPIACFVASDERELLGFACYDATARGFFGPTGVREDHRREGIGRALLFAALHDMAAQGYAYAIVGAAGAVEFYQKELGAMAIPESAPGFYRGMLRQ